MKTQKVWFVTGASKGFGLEIAKEALKSGDKVVATVRNKPEQLTTILNNHPNLLVVVMDVTKENEVKMATEQAIAQFETIDVLVNNAGFGIVAAIEEASDAEARKLYDTNVFGLLNVTRAVVPYLRKQRSGHIINISSLFGYGAIPGWALYGSTKYAVEGISVGLSLELAPFGINVTALAPGLFSTEFLSTESYSVGGNVIDDYSETTVGQMKTGAKHLHGTQQGDPQKLAKVVVQLANTVNPPLHLPVGKDSLETYRSNAAKTSKEIEQWSEVFISTEHGNLKVA